MGSGGRKRNPLAGPEPAATAEGRVWFDDLKFEVLGDTPTEAKATGRKAATSRKRS